jgi:uncharacterized membrane protein HdeD (DUF308 family)
METQDSLDTLSSKAKIRYGLFFICVGLIVSVGMLKNPERLNAPLWLALLAGSTFIIAGIAVCIHAFVSAKVYAWLIVFLLSVMTCIPAWIAFGSGVRQCSASIPLLEGELGCRAMFSIATVFCFGMVLLAGRSAIKAQSAQS